MQREESLTPLQTLAVLNDKGFLEAARALATKVQAGGAADDSAAVRSAFLRATGHLPSQAQLQALATLLAEAITYYQAHPGETAALLSSAGPPAGSPSPRTAALMVVCRALFSSEEFLRTW